MSRAYVIGDLHFGHRKLQEIRGLGDQDLIDRWNSVVTKRDVVYVLGDVFRLDRVPELLGVKKLALGNHDKRRMEDYLKHFSKVGAMFMYDNALLTHIPVHPNQRARWKKNVHGHSHEHVVTRSIAYPPNEGESEVSWGSEPDPWYICVSAEQINYTPVLLSEVLK